MENNQKRDVSMTLDDLPRFVSFNLTDYSEQHNSQIEENYLQLPLLFNDLHPPFSGINHLNALYKQSYFCILHGLYHAGIVVMTQLLEETVREIIRINTGTLHQGTLDHLLGTINSPKGNATQYLIHPILIDQITTVKNQIRNPYTHMRYKEIFKGKSTPVARMKIQMNSDGIIETPIDKKKEEPANEISLHELDLGLEPSISSIFKEEYDKKLAFKLAWEIFALYWLLLELYLSSDRYDKYIQEHGSFIENLPSWNPAQPIQSQSQQTPSRTSPASYQHKTAPVKKSIPSHFPADQ